MNTENQFPKTVAGITFTETGILIEQPYKKDYLSGETNESKFTGEYLEIAKRLAKTRMSHCKNQLYTNLLNATHITVHEIGWNGGHFNVAVYETLENILELTDVRKLNKLQTQQLIRAMLLNDANIYVFDECSEPLEVTEDFKNFITEHMFCL